MVKKKKKDDMNIHQPVIDSSDSDDSDYIVFESDDTISEPCWDEDSDYSDESSDESSDDDLSDDSVTSDDDISESPVLVINIKTMRHVRFSNETVTHVIEIEDRKGYWVEDRFRFQQRCTSVRDAISFVFDEMHRRKMRLIVNMSDTLRGAIAPYFSNPFEAKPTTISSFSNISRGHMTIMYMPAHVCETTTSLRALAPTPTWWRS